MEYPNTKKVSVVDNYHGVVIPDPYRWLEDLDSEETRIWVEEQNKVTFDYLQSIPERDQIRKRLTELWDYEKYGVPHREGNRWFFSKNDGLQNQSVLYTAESLDGPFRILLDPNALSADGTVALVSYAISKDGNLLAYGLSSGGSDWMEWKVRDVSTGQDLADHLKWIKFSSATWTNDHSGFFYSRFNEPAPGEAMEQANYFNKLYYHKLGTDQSQDLLIYERPDQKEWNFYSYVTEDGRYLVVTVSKGTDPRYSILYRDLSSDAAGLVELIPGFEAEYSFIGNEENRFWFKTNLNAPRGSVIEIDLLHPEKQNWKVVIPEMPDTLDSVSLINRQLIAAYLKDARSDVRIYDLSGTLIRNLELPGLGTAGGFTGKFTDKKTYFAFTSFTVPVAVFQCDLDSGQISELWKPKLLFSPDDYETHQVFYRSNDGTSIPMFLSFRKGLQRNGKTKAFLYGYGGFNISLTPAFSLSALVWMEMGGIYAVANIRGGGEYGEEWHRAGTGVRKQNVFDDFIAASEWLIGNEYTSSEHLAIGGGSNGGLLVAACMIQRPDLYAAVLPSVGVLDMLRFHKFTIGWAWVDDYGSSDNPDEFRTLYSYSPLHNLKSGTKYPAVLICTADHDDRVVPAHSFKFAAALQEAHAGSKPVLIRIDVRAGHGMGKPTAKLIEEIADKWAFLFSVL